VNIQKLNQLHIDVRRVRRLCGLSQESLTDLADLNRMYVSFIARLRRNVSIRNIQCLTAALAVDARDVLDCGCSGIGHADMRHVERVMLSAARAMVIVLARAAVLLNLR
jgi:transcriptional regulator with XRE-family HTH domain